MADERYHLLTEHEHIDLKKIRDVDLWTDVLGIYTADLFNAVAVVGTLSTAVLQYVVDNGLVGNRHRTPDPKPRPAGKVPGGGTRSPTGSSA